MLLDINNIQCSVDVEGTTPFNYEFSSSLSSIEVEEPSCRYLLSPDLEDIIPPTLEEQCREPVQNPPKPQHWDLDGVENEKSGDIIVHAVRSSPVPHLHDTEVAENSFLNEESETEHFQDIGSEYVPSHTSPHGSVRTDASSK